jgi:hypothetical protein
MLNSAIDKMATDANGPGVTIIQSNTISRTALVAGYGQSGSQQSAAIRCIGGGVTIRRNIIEDVGYVGIVLSGVTGGGGHLCEENIIRRAQLLLDDGGTLDINSHSNTVRRNLVFDTYGNRDVSNGQIGSGFVHGQMGFCIFTQPNDNGNVIEQNTLANNTGGILLDTTCNSLVRSNVVYNTRGDTTGVYTPFHLSLLAGSSPMGLDDQLVDNIFYSLSSTQNFINVMTTYDSGFIDRNYYCNPYGPVMMREIYPNFSIYTNYTLAEWRARYPARDPHSVTSRVAFPADAVTGIPAEDAKLFVNTNTTATYFSFRGNTYQDLDGNPVTGGIWLEPFYSRVLVLRSLAPATSECLAVSADYDGDGKADPGLYGAADGAWYVRLSGGGYQLAVLTGFGGIGYAACEGDYDGDRKADPAVCEAVSGKWQVKLSASGYADASLLGFGGADWQAVAGDYDGDGKWDPAIYNSTNGDWRVALSSLGYAIASAAGFGGAGYAAVEGNYDADQRCDAAIYDEAAGNWTVLLSAQNYLTATLGGFGGTGYEPVSGDFDGDGLADPAIYEQVTGNWSVRLSGSGYAAANLDGFGGTGYQASAADFDGDRKADLTLFETATGLWHVKLSASGYATATLASGYIP